MTYDNDKITIQKFCDYQYIVYSLCLCHLSHPLQTKAEGVSSAPAWLNVLKNEFFWDDRTSKSPLPCPPPPPGERVLASGSVQLPRFTLLESGSLLISPSHISDAGTYTCMASNSRGIDEASADLLVWGE